MCIVSIRIRAQSDGQDNKITQLVDLAQDQGTKRKRQGNFGRGDLYVYRDPESDVAVQAEEEFLGQRIDAAKGEKKKQPLMERSATTKTPKRTHGRGDLGYDGGRARRR